MATSNYFNAAYPEPWQILGVKLRPFSLGHYIKLHRLDCAFVADETRPATLADLVLGIAVCSMSSDADPQRDEFWQWLTSQKQDFGLRIRNVALRLFRRPQISQAEWDAFKFGKKVGVFDFPEKVKLFAEYVSAHSEPPAYNESPDSTGEPKTSGAHWSHSLMHVLISKCGYTQREALNVPLSKAFQDFFKVAEENGTIKLLPIEVAEAQGL